MNVQQNPHQQTQNDKYTNQSGKAGQSHSAGSDQPEIKNPDVKPRVGNNIQKDEPVAESTDTGMRGEGTTQGGAAGHKATTNF